MVLMCDFTGVSDAGASVQQDIGGPSSWCEASSVQYTWSKSSSHKLTSCFFMPFWER